MWPGLVGKGDEEGQEPPISLERMLDLTAAAEVDGQKFDGIDYLLFLPHTNPQASDDELKGIAEGAEMRAAAATKDRDAMKARLETVDGDLSGRVADAERRVLGEKERAGRAELQNTKLQGALDAAQRDVKRLRAHAAQAGDDIDKSLLREAQAKLRCSVCDDREKTTCLIRCMHTFCRECVQKNIDNRSRKCPACGERFGKDDVKDIYLVT